MGVPLSPTTGEDSAGPWRARRSPAFPSAVKEGGGAEAAGVFVVERGVRSASLMSELLYAVICTGQLGAIAGVPVYVGAGTVYVRKSAAGRGLWGQRCLSADDLVQAGGARRESSEPRLGAVGGLGR